MSVVGTTLSLSVTIATSVEGIIMKKKKKYKENEGGGAQTG